jgi:hypothetical protein
MAQNADLVGNTLIVSDIQISATGVAGVGATGNSVSTFMAGATSVTSQAGTLTVINSQTATSGGTASKAGIILGSSGPGIYFGLGAPSGLTAATGSIYLNTQSSTIAATTAIYSNTNGISTWVAVL